MAPRSSLTSSVSAAHGSWYARNKSPNRGKIWAHCCCGHHSSPYTGWAAAKRNYISQMIIYGQAFLLAKAAKASLT